jgi:DNA-binding MarR family transcriptional regulator
VVATKKNADSAIERLNRDSYILLSILTSQLSADIERLCKEVDLTEAHFRVLWAVCQPSSAHGIAMGEIADGLINRAADLTRLVDKLEKLKYVDRKQSPDDRRKMIVHATPTGRKVFTKLAATVKELHFDQWDGLTQTELRELKRLLNKALETRVTWEDRKAWQV